MKTPAHLTWKAAILALLLFIGTAGVAFAAALSLSGGHVGTGSAGTSCQTSSIATSWVLEYDADVPGYTITGVTLGGLSEACHSRSVRVVVADATGVQVTAGTGTIPDTGTSATVTFDSPFTMGSTWLRQATVMIYA